ncbi:restriction endonuclease subunit S [Candidatus Arthromitus sp. SFB-rat-Yit]|uniref:restriction endonuclease subunit S n=1 Tax=Candidatus Arthromitus sp. SFB-rat-Yit TaxID=1041504 RepID=UPI000227A417|nr:restriction endonuclease subunit S [Candidatus Arthromitus sp. SFB-rat-Yit]BAK81527.1 type I restriction modification DNA specificity domain protein [Candidatus Arthromitus sp. SFB-rat-Yit]
MGKFDKLIKELCPDGVEWKEIGEFLDYEQPTKYIVKSTEYSDKYDIPVLTAGQSFVLGYTNEKDGLYKSSKDKPVIIFDDFTASFHWVDFVFKIKSSAMKMLTPKSKDSINFRFIYHCMKNIGYSNNDHTRQWIGKYSKFKIPIPPLELQEEIVHILDLFTNLTEELTAELTARRKQYEYYRDKLLMFGDGVEWKQFGECATIFRGASPRPIREFITTDSSGVNWIKIGDVKIGEKYITCSEERITKEGAEKSRFVKKGDLILSNSMSFGRPYILKINGCVHDGWLIISNFSNYYLTDFLYYLLNSNIYQNEMKKKASFGGAVQNLNANIVKGLVLPLPPLEEQERIVSILDKFDKLCNDLTEGLPAEIEARRKQYEYYRDKLLTFKELEKIN